MAHFSLLSSVLVVILTVAYVASALNLTETLQIYNGSISDPSPDLEGALQYYMNRLCSKRVILRSRGDIRMSLWSTYYPPSGEKCQAEVEMGNYQNYHLGVTFKYVQMSSAGSSGVCKDSRLDLYSGSGTRYPLTAPDGICGNKPAKKEYGTTSGTLTLIYTTLFTFKTSRQELEAVITPFHYGRCQHDEFRCANNKCILDSLVCNGYNNCGDDSDERHCAKFALSVAAIIGIVIGSVVFLSILLVLCICCCCSCSVYERF